MLELRQHKSYQENKYGVYNKLVEVLDFTLISSRFETPSILTHEPGAIVGFLALR